MSITLKIHDGDVVISAASGRPATISDRQKLKQDIREFFTVNVQPNGFGSGLDELVGIMLSDPTAMVSIAYQNISEGLLRFAALQRDNGDIIRPDTELIQSFNNLRVEADNTDPTKFYFTVNIITRSGESMPHSQLIL
jgi:hypothetical protein